MDTHTHTHSAFSWSQPGSIQWRASSDPYIQDRRRRTQPYQVPRLFCSCHWSEQHHWRWGTLNGSWAPFMLKLWRAEFDSEKAAKRQNKLGSLRVAAALCAWILQWHVVVLENRGAWKRRWGGRYIWKGETILHLHSCILHACREAPVDVHFLLADIADGLLAVTGPRWCRKEASILPADNWIETLGGTIDLIVVIAVARMVAIVLIVAIVVVHIGQWMDVSSSIQSVTLVITGIYIQVTSLLEPILQETGREVSTHKIELGVNTALGIQRMAYVWSPSSSQNLTYSYSRTGWPHIADGERNSCA